MFVLFTKMYAVFVCVGVFVFANGYVNVAFNKPAYQQHQQKSDTYDASTAVDGRKSDLSGWGGQCAASYGKNNATWWVNLTTIHSIHHITIYFRTDNVPWDRPSVKEGVRTIKDPHFSCKPRCEEMVSNGNRTFSLGTLLLFWLTLSIS